MDLLAFALLQIAGAPATPAVIRPAPDPWPTPAQACSGMQDEARGIARRTPRRHASFRVVEQVVDCEARTVTRVIALEYGPVDLASSALQTADRFACASPRNQIMYERDGWSFRAEFRGPDGQAATAAAQAACPPLPSTFRYERREPEPTAEGR